MKLRIGMVCFPTLGGSGIVASELGRHLARRGHEVHFVASAPPQRFDPSEAGLFFHAVEPLPYPVFPETPYSLALASKLVAVCRTHHLHVLHVHYAVPHAVSAWMARDILGDEAPGLVTTLHGTDTTLVGVDPSYWPVTQHALLHSDVLTTPSAWLRDETRRGFALGDLPHLEVIPNFVDLDHYRPRPGPARPLLEAHFGPDVPPALVHVSNFRPLKRVDRVIEVFARLHERRPVRLVLVGEGPESAAAHADLERRGLLDHCWLAGPMDDVAPLLAEAHVLLLPSETESFGLAALEALACGVPAITSDVGGLPEVVGPTVGGCFPGHDLAAMVDAAERLVSDPHAHRTAATEARQRALSQFVPETSVGAYEQLYRAVRRRGP